MDLHYNAFISYRHHPDDIRVAEQIHRSLERFHVPAAIRKRCGKIQRLFRDKDELPITSNLTDDITRALKNADYLIVICSVHTAESIWVQREIELFLTTHDRSRILTVLASGEPQDTIPQILQYQDITDPVTGKTVRQPLEPLSCDWRMPKAKRMREELPRLAAALLGCGYDELRQRQRQYRHKRMILGFSAALALCACLTGYFIYTGLKIRQANNQLENANDRLEQANTQLEQANVDIRENLFQALKNQSQYLASSARERLAAGDRLTAIALAAAALPWEEAQRPYVTEAELALTQALGLYNPTPGLSAVGAFTTDMPVSGFCVSPDGTALYALDTAGVLYIFDTQTFQKRTQMSFYDAPQEVSTTASGNILIRFSLGAACYSAAGDRLWSLECRDLAQLSDGTVLALYGDSMTAPRIDCVDPATGEVLRSLALPTPEGLEPPLGFSTESFTPEDPILLNYPSTGLTRDVYALVDGQLNFICHAAYNLFQVSCDRQGNVLVLQSDGTGMNNGRVGDMWYSEPVGLQVLCVDAATGQLRWQYDFQSFFFSNCRTLCQIPGKDLILCQYANEFLVLDLQGKLVNYSRATAIPVIAGATEAEFWGILQDGNIFFYPYGDSVRSMDYLLDGITSARVNGAYYVATDTNQIIAYSNLSHEPDQVLEAQFTASTVDFRVFGDCLAVTTYTDIYYYDLRENTLLWTAPLSGNCTLLGQSRDAQTLWLAMGRDRLLSIDTQTGESRELSLPAQLEQTATVHTAPKLLDERLYYTVFDGDHLYLASCDPQGQDYQVCTDAPMPYQSCSVLAKSEDGVYLWMHTDRQILCVESQGAYQVFSEQFQTQPAVLSVPNDCLFADNSGIVSASTNLDGSFEYAGLSEVCSMYLYDRELLVLFNDGTLQRYSASAELVASTALILPDNIRRQMELDRDVVRWDLTKDGDLLVTVAGYGNLIHIQSWQSRAHFANCLGYDPEADHVIIRGNKQLSLYDLRTTGQVLEMAEEALAGFVMSQDTKAEYGLP